MLDTALFCLALNIYFEARNEPEIAQLAVAHVTLNRAKFFNKSVCEVVFEPKQFSWTHGRHERPINDPVWLKIQGLAARAQDTCDPTGGARWFHTTDIRPQWSYKLKYVGTWGNHRFYKEK